MTTGPTSPTALVKHNQRHRPLILQCTSPTSMTLQGQMLVRRYEFVPLCAVIRLALFCPIGKCSAVKIDEEGPLLDSRPPPPFVRNVSNWCGA